MTPGFTLTRTLPCTPAQAWHLLTDPEQMNRWSTAGVRISATGVRDRPDAVGTLRMIKLPGRGGILREVLDYNVFPHTFHYRVYDGGPLLTHHHGTQRLTEVSDGCRLTWAVETDLILTTAARVMARVVRRQVDESLDRLVEVAASPPRVVPPGPDPLTPPAVDTVAMTRALRAAAESLDEQRCIADRLAENDDPKQWFARVYQYVTEEMISAAVGADRLPLDNPYWVLALIPAFHEYFTRNLAAYENDSNPEKPWRRAWSTCERTDPANPARPVMTGLIRGVSAHIDSDLPRALADVHRVRYHHRDIREFRSDYLRLTPVFTVASTRLVADLPRSHRPWWTGVATRIHPQVRDALLARNGYDVGRHRVAAFAAAVDATVAQQVRNRRVDAPG